MKFILLILFFFAYAYSSDNGCIESEVLKLYHEQQTTIESLQKELKSLKYKPVLTAKSTKPSETIPHEYQTNQIMIYQDLNNKRDDNKSLFIENQKILLEKKTSDKETLAEIYAKMIERTQTYITYATLIISILAILFGLIKKYELIRLEQDMDKFALELKENIQTFIKDSQEKNSDLKDDLKEFKNQLKITIENYSSKLNEIKEQNLSNFKDQVQTMLDEATDKYSGQIAEQIKEKVNLDKYVEILDDIEKRLAEKLSQLNIPDQPTTDQPTTDQPTIDQESLAIIHELPETDQAYLTQYNPSKGDSNVK